MYLAMIRDSMDTAIGLVAAAFTSLSYLPQVLKSWRTRRAADVSTNMLLVLLAGLLLWVVYGVLHRDVVIIAANVVSSLLLAVELALKYRFRHADHEGKTAESQR